MNVLMLGNGFDLNYDLPTKYINFLNTVNCIAKRTGDAFSVGEIFSDKDLLANDTGIARSYEKYASVYDAIPVDACAVERLKAIAKNNLWFAYLIKSFNRDIGWIDFEQEIATVLCSFRAFLPKLNLEFPRGNFPNDLIHNYIFRKFDFFYQEQSEYGSINGVVVLDQWYSVKEKYILEYPLGSNNKIINKEAVIETLEHELLELAEGLKLYLQYFVDNVVVELCKRNAVKPLVGLQQAEHIVTLNYTNTYEHIYGEGSVYHIHGNLSDRVILGINPDDSDKLESIDTLFLPFKKYYQRVINCSDVEYLDWISNEDAYISLAVMGHSLDATDKDIIMQMFEKAKDITVLYHNEKVKASLVSNLINIYGKEQFDELRINKHLRFLPQNMEFNEFAEDRFAIRCRREYFGPIVTVYE